MIKIRLLSQYTLAYHEDEDKLEKFADGEPNLWTDEFIYEVAVLGERTLNKKAHPSEPDSFTQTVETFIVRTWFEAQGHGEMDIDPTPDGNQLIHVPGFGETTVAKLVSAAILVGWIASEPRAWVEITPEFVSDATAQYAL